jgi:RNA recognition motif-containing protein
MSTDTSLWMGDIQPWMDEDFILKAFRHYNINPISVKLIHDRNTHDLKNFCFIYFENIEQANNCIFMLNGKSIPQTKIKFKLNWANYYSTFNKSVYVGNLSPDVDDISLYNLFKEKYSSVHHASVVTDNGKSKGFGFILFRGEKDYERCLTEMNGISFHGNIIKVSEQRKKEDDIKNNNSNNNENNDNYMYNFNNMSDVDLINNYHNPNIGGNIDINTLNKLFISNNLNKNRNNFNNNINPQISSDRSNRNNINNLNSLNNLNNFQIEQNKFLNPYNQNNISNNNNQNIINNIININNINKINNINYINEKNTILNKNQIMNNTNSNFNNSYNPNFNNILELPNHPSLFQRSNISNQKTDNDSLIINNKNSIINNNNNNMKSNKNSFSFKNYKNNNNIEFKIENLEKYDDITLKAKIRENLNKMYNYYMEVYPGDVNKLKCKLYILIYF